MKPKAPPKTKEIKQEEFSRGTTSIKDIIQTGFDIGFSKVTGKKSKSLVLFQKSSLDDINEGFTEKRCVCENGKVYLDNVSDSLIYNYDEDKMIVGVDLDELIIINTQDAILITKKNSMGKDKKIVESFPGTKHESLI